MNFLELTKERYSTRAFSAQAVEEEKINYLLECARRAPSACNKQPWHFVVAETAEARNKVQQCYNRDWIKQAPLYIIIRQFGIRKCPKKLVISLLFCNFIVVNQ